VIAILSCADILLIDDEHDARIAHALNEILDGLYIPGHAGLVNRGEYLYFIHILAVLALTQDFERAHIAPCPGENAVFHHLIIFNAGLGVDDRAQDVLHGLALGIVERAITRSRNVIESDSPEAGRFDLGAAGGCLREQGAPPQEANANDEQDFSVQGVLLTAVDKHRGSQAQVQER